MRLEQLLRLISLAIFAWLIAGTFIPRDQPNGLVVEDGRLAEVLGNWAESPEADTLGLLLRTPLDRVTRDFVRALRGSGTAVTWVDSGVEPLMVELEPLSDPAGGAVARLAGRKGSAMALRDSLGRLDSMSLDGIGASIRVPAFAGALVAESRRARAVISAEGVASPRGVLVLGMAGWESKFIVRALEERGWRVHARLAVAPGLQVDQGQPFPIDTARLAAVIALDSAAGRYSGQIAGFVRAGGGLIVAGRAGSQPIRGVAALPRQVTAWEPEDHDSLTAWRFGSGRVLQIRERDTWRRRLAVRGEAVADHRSWWAGLVTTVAYRPVGSRVGTGDPGPLAATVLALDVPTRLPVPDGDTARWPLLLGLLLVGLFGEWVSRRLRGAP
jgi:hypothetical protein